jgi:hypothetical protein
MGTQIELAVKRLFDEDALGATNIKMFPGTSRDVTAEQLANEINKAISKVEAGEFDIVTDEECCA